MKATLQLPRLLLEFGAIDALPQELQQLAISRPLLITDAGLVACGVVARVRKAAPEISHIFDHVTENPIFADCDAAALQYREGGCDGIVAVGGGSVLDAAKLTAIVAGHGGRAADYAGHSERVTRATAPVIAVPTTAGTGSEASPAAGVHSNSQSRSVGVGSPFIVPKVAICDPDLTLSLPPVLTAATGIDALTHCIEGYLATTMAPTIDALALDGIGRIQRHVAAATRDGSNREARRQLMIAAFAGGAAISKGLGPAHAIAIGCGDQGVHHGKLSAIGLIASLRVLAEPCAAKLQHVAVAMGLDPRQAVVDGLIQLMQGLGLPTDLAAAGYRVADIDELASYAAGSYFNKTSPYQPNVAQYKKMIASVAG